VRRTPASLELGQWVRDSLERLLVPADALDLADGDDTLPRPTLLPPRLQLQGPSSHHKGYCVVPQQAGSEE